MKMKSPGNACLLIALAGFLIAPGLASAQNAISAPASKTIGHGKTEIVPSLIVLNARGAKSPRR